MGNDPWNDAMGEDDEDQQNNDQSQDYELINDDYVREHNKKRVDNGDTPLPFEEYLWYRKEKKNDFDDDGNPKPQPEYQNPNEVNNIYDETMALNF